MKKPATNENDLLARIEKAFRSTGPPALTLQLGDDAALWRPRAGFETVLTCDWFLEDCHFRRYQHPADAVGWKCLARAVSDIAAMGGAPRCFLLSVALPLGLTGQWFTGFLHGLRRASSTLRCHLAGGDTTRHHNVLINVTVVGELPRGRALLRSGARAGDALFVSGRLGEAEAGRHQWKKPKRLGGVPSAAVRKHLYPVPRLGLGQWLAEQRLATAAMDLSDGLSTDLPRLCAASGVGARIELDRLPIGRRVPLHEARLLALHGGDDYELLFAVKQALVRKIPGSLAGVRLTRIGEITREKHILLVENGHIQRLEPGGWDPFES
jgi:thiamine-monophosphate kinase